MKRQEEDYRKVATNIVRHRGGMYYLRAKVGGQKVRRSLDTKDLEVAKMKRDEVLRQLKGAEATEAKIATVGDALEVVARRMIEKPGLKDATKLYYETLKGILAKELPVRLAGSQWTREACRQWWIDCANRRGSTQANNLLQMVRKVAKLLKDAGLRADIPTTGLLPLKVRASAVDHLPSREAIERVLANMRGHIKNGRGRDMGADMVEFLAWSGLRMGEITSLEWRHVSDKWITVTGGEAGTKNQEVRRVPINKRLAAILDRMRYPGASGPVFPMKSPTKAFRAACDRCGVPKMRMHDLRHLFATTAIESGVDIPTVSRWLGHKDGGVLAMRTYGHLRDDHSLESAKKLA